MTDLWARQELYFDEGQYLLADSAYPISTVTVPVVKGPDGLTQDGLDFNTAAANLQAVNEHCIGMLKCHWRSLTSLPLRIHRRSEAKDVARVLDWITACAILHNFLVSEREILHKDICSPFRGTHPVGGDIDLAMAPSVEELENGETFRRYVMGGVLQAARAPGGIVHYHANRPQ